MTASEELSHKRVQAVYLRKLLDNVNDEIKELEQAEPYAELKAAHAAGKRIAHRHNNGSDKSWSICHEPAWYEHFNYKIVDDNEIEIISCYVFSTHIKVAITKYDQTGYIAAQVVE